MPTYDYQCPQCGVFDAFRTMSQRNAPMACPACEAPAERVLVAAPRLSCVTAEVRNAHATNERARHAPKHSRDVGEGSYGRMRHPSGCGCCSNTSKKGATVTAADGAKTFPSKRPWMIIH